MPNEDSLSTKLTDGQLKELLDTYLKEGIPVADPWINRHRARVQKTKADLFNVDHLKSATDEELAPDLIEHYRWAVRVPLYYRSIEQNVDKVRAGLLYLLESEDSLQTRVDQVIDENGRYKVFGIAKSFWSTFFQPLDPAGNPRWNDKAERALDNLGMRYWKAGDSPGQVYVAVQRAQLALAALRDDLDLFILDNFMHYVTVQEGKNIIDRWLGQVEPTLPVDEMSERMTIERIRGAASQQGIHSELERVLSLAEALQLHPVQQTTGSVPFALPARWKYKTVFRLGTHQKGSGGVAILFPFYTWDIPRNRVLETLRWELLERLAHSRLDEGGAEKDLRLAFTAGNVDIFVAAICTIYAEVVRDLKHTST